MIAPTTAKTRSPDTDAGARTWAHPRRQAMRELDEAVAIITQYEDAPCFSALLGEYDEEVGCSCPTCGHRAALAALKRVREGAVEGWVLDDGGWRLTFQRDDGDPYDFLGKEPPRAILWVEPDEESGR